MKKVLAGLAISGLVLSVSVAQAADSGAGCGIGAEVMEGKDGKGAHIAAAVINGLIPSTFFMTTGGGLMGCDPTKAVEVEQLKKSFVASNMDQLSTDAAKGSGEYLTALGHLMGVEQQNIPAFERLTQSNFTTLFGSDSSAEQVLASLDLAMSQDAALSRYATR